MKADSLEKIISLEDIDYAHFWGTNDKILEFVKILFPKLKIIARGEMLKLIGTEEDINNFEKKLDKAAAELERELDTDDEDADDEIDKEIDRAFEKAERELDRLEKEVDKALDEIDEDSDDF